MLPWITVERATSPDGTGLALLRRGTEWEVQADGMTLMTSRTHSSEIALANIAFEKRPGARRVLVGGLGLGYTLRAALDRLPGDGRVVVAELTPQLVEWNRTHVGDLAGRPLADPRAEVRIGDVCGRILEGKASYDAILLDVDNGPVALAQGSNAWLYGDGGVHACQVALTAGGVLAVWSAGQDEAYLRRLRRHGFEASSQTVRAHRGAGQRHVVFLAVKAAAAPEPMR